VNSWIRDRGLTLTLLALFALSLAGQIVTGWHEYNADAREHAQPGIVLLRYLATGHFLEALFENWESEFLQMAAFVMLTTFLYHRGSAESRRPHVIELVDADPRDFADQPGVPWPVRRGGGVLWLYERSLGLAFVVLFALSFAGHAVGGWLGYAQEQTAHGQGAPTFTEYLASSRFWFESMQNWQSEFLSIAAMVWLTVYLRQRGSPESKPVHASHDETGR
jgi:hypothetical protein